MFEREVIWMMEDPMKGWSRCWGQLRTRSGRDGVREKIVSRMVWKLKVEG